MEKHSNTSKVQSYSGGEAQADSSTPKANNRTRRARNYRNRRGATDPKDLIPGDLKMIKFTDDDDNEVFTRRTLSLTLEEVRSVCGQLGYMPLNIVSVGAKNEKKGMGKAPLVAILYPLAMNKLARQGRSHMIKKQDEIKSEWDPFPTTCWLTCPLLHAQICKLEDAGWIQTLEKRLQESEIHVKAMEAAHRNYQTFRWNLLSASDRILVEKMGWSDMLKEKVGIAGIRVFNSVKCLHCHYAHFLARPSDQNVIGMWVDAILTETGFNRGASKESLLTRGGFISPSRVLDTRADYLIEYRSSDGEDLQGDGGEDKEDEAYTEQDDSNSLQHSMDLSIDFLGLESKGIDVPSIVSAGDNRGESPFTPIRDRDSVSQQSPYVEYHTDDHSEVGTDLSLGTDAAEHAHNENPYGFHWGAMLSPAKSTMHRSRVPGKNTGTTPMGQEQCQLSDCICT